MNTDRFPLTAGLILGLVFIATVLALLGTGQQWMLDMLGLVEQGKRDHFGAMIVIYVVAFAILATLTLPIGTLFCLAAGYLFGVIAGFLSALAGALLAAALTFYLVRHFGGTAVRLRLASGRTAPWLRSLERDATWYLILLRIIPVAPYFAVNAAAAVTGIRSWHFLLATSVGMVPTTLVYASVGAGLGSLIEAREILGPDLLLRPEIAFPLAGLLLIIIISWAFRHRLQSSADNQPRS